ncbi:WRKY domain-containing protein [Cephalotus follicularis]|uniref:WRKY domain-containing protein n=1 Tax=Cephalotus follicularis TaxID=3775 RepID=A0A1Q3BDZ1_CEPFO|nr:WRKY domain-containing protein [Cephalotus follicularis]
MENMGDWGKNKNLVMNELTQGKELAKQLQIHLKMPSSSHETREMLIQMILTSYEKALSMLNCKSNSEVEQHHVAGIAIRSSESPPSLTGSPRSDDSDRDFKDQEHKDVSKKRKTLPRWTQRVRVNPGTGLEDPLDDGFSWRKYGQKCILGAKYPRGYYRCTHRNVQSCWATKQVQRSDEDPMIFEVTYSGSHTCRQAPLKILPSNQEPNRTSIGPQQPLQIMQQPPPDQLLNFQSSLKVITEGLDTCELSFPYHFASTSNAMPPENNVNQPSINDTDFMGSISPSFISPSTSGTNYFSMSPSGINSFQGIQNFNDRSELAEITTSASNSPTVALDFPFANDPNFTFDNYPGFFS